MRSLLMIFALVLFAITSNANIKVGDAMTYKSYFGRRCSLEGAYYVKTEVMEIDLKNKRLLLHGTKWSEDSSAKTEQTYYKSIAEFEKLIISKWADLKNCETIQDDRSFGTLEEVTVPAGTFKTCKVTTLRDNTPIWHAWYAEGLTFAVVKQQNGRCPLLETTMIEYVSGK